MRRKLFSFFLVVWGALLPILWVSCEEEHIEPEIVIPETPDRTVLLYIVGDNSLSSYASRNVDSIVSGMKKIHTSLQILVYQDNTQLPPTIWKVERDAQGVVQKNIFKTYSEDQNSADPDVMSEIIKEVFDQCPGREKGLILWAHGTGWLPSPGFAPSQRIAYSFGPDQQSYMELWDIRTALEKTGLHFNFVGFDACLMSGVEVAYELKEVADYLILSPTEIMGRGFPYQTMVPILGLTDLDLPAVCNAYMQFYDGKESRDGTISLIRTDLLEDLATSYKSILKQITLPDAVSGKTIQQMGRRIPFSTADYSNVFYDMGDLVNKAAAPLYLPFEAALNRAVIYKNNTPRFLTFDINTNSGLTVFIPELHTNQQYLQTYPLLRWYQATRQGSEE